MRTYKFTKSEEKFAELIWKNEPILSSELARLCKKEFDWERTTTYTVLKKLSQKGIFKNEKAVVSSVIKRDEYYARQSIHFVDDTFGGSLPKFIAAFMGEKKLSKQQVAELKKLIDEYDEEE